MNRKRDNSSLDPKHPALSPTRPLFVDNRAGNTLDKAILQHLQALRQEGALPWELCIATAFFNAQGFNLLADELEQLASVRLLLGAEPQPEATAPIRNPGDPEEPEYTRKQVTTELQRLDDGLCRARDLLPFDEPTDAAIRRLLSMLHTPNDAQRPKIEVRRYERQFLHAKAFIFRVLGGGLLVGSSNFTLGGLRRNLELNLGHYEDPVVGKVETWFDELWENAAPYDLAALFDRLMAEHSPYLIYLRVLYALYAGELDEETEDQIAQSDIPTTTFQKHGVWRALRILRKYGGVLIADGVGLGKTFVAGEIIRLFREQRQRVLLVCPAALRDSTWREFLYTYLNYTVECISYEQLARDRQLGGDQEHLRSSTDDYALVLIDEAHNYRNPDAPTRAKVLRQLLRGQRRDLVMMSATPVNNSLWDLYYILRFFIKQDAILADRGVLSIRERFDDAMQVDPFNLNPDLLYPIIDATTVKRTRRFVKKNYSNDLIKLPDGRRVPIQFPKPAASSINYDLEEAMPGFLGELEDALMPLNGLPRLSMARYQPDRYPADEPRGTSDTALVGLLRSALLKRFESSIYAFAETTRRMEDEHTLFLKGLDQGIVMRKNLLQEVSAAGDDDDAFEEMLATSEYTESADAYNVTELRAAVEADRDLLREFRIRAQSVKPEDGPKLAALVEELARIADEAKREAIDDDDRRRKQKVLVFSAYTDTINWIESYLEEMLERDKRLACYRDRMASVAGDETRNGVTRDEAVHGFAPESSGASPAQRADRFDLLLSTDVLAEGMNLQQCRNIINFDMPWNPMRLVQRHGRIDRIGSLHSQVYLRTFFPDEQLDALLNLEMRVRVKLARAAASVGVEVAPIERGAEGQQSFSETREEIERLRRDDPSIYEAGGTQSAAQTGEEYRQELRTAMLSRRDEIEGLPWKAGSGMVKGTQRGHFFCATIGDRVYLRFVPYGLSDSDAIASEIGTCLRMIECNEGTPREVPIDLKQTAFAAWEKARQHIHASWTRETDPANLQPRVSRFNRQLAEFLRTNPPAGMDQARVEQCLDAIEAPCSRRDENTMRQVFGQVFRSNAAKSAAIVEAVEEIGLEPFKAPEPLPPVTVDEVHLICWMAIESE